MFQPQSSTIIHDATVPNTIRTLLPIGSKSSTYQLQQQQWDLIQQLHQTTSTTTPTRSSLTIDTNSIPPPPPPPPPFPTELSSRSATNSSIQSTHTTTTTTTTTSSTTSNKFTFSHARNLSRAHIRPPPPPPPPPLLTSPNGGQISSPHERIPSKETAAQLPQSLNHPPTTSPTLTTRPPSLISPTRAAFQPGRSQPPPLPSATTSPQTPSIETRSSSQSLPTAQARFIPPPPPGPPPATPRQIPPPPPALALPATPSNPSFPPRSISVSDESTPARPSRLDVCTPRSTIHGRVLPPPLPVASTQANRQPSGSAAKPPNPPSTTAASTASGTRAKIESEILSTEASYLSNLQHFVSEFLTPLRARIKSGKKEDSVGDLDEAGVNNIAGNIETITNFHESFYQDLQDEFSRASRIANTHPNLAKIFIKYSNFFKMYTAYLNSYESCVVEMEELRENEKFQAYVKSFMVKVRRTSQSTAAAPVVRGGSTFVLPTSPPPSFTPSASNATSLSPMDYIIQPVQRLPRYVLLLKELLKNVPEGSKDAEEIQTALTSMEAIASFVNERKRSVENMNRLLDISLRISGELPKDVHLIEPHRKLIREGNLSIISSRSILGVGLGTCKSKDCIVRLFNDMILWTNTSNKFKGWLDLNTTGVILSDQDELCFQLSDAKTTIFCRHESYEEIRSWCEQIQATIATLQDEKESTRRRQRVMKARSIHHTHRTQLRALIQDNLFQLPGTEDQMIGGVDNQEKEHAMNDAIASDPQLQSSWLEKEVAAQKQREREKRHAASKATDGPPMMGMLLPKDVIAQLKATHHHQQVAATASPAHGSTSTCTTRPNSVGSSREHSPPR